ncbi:hypothetical protein D3Z36_06430 [Lachnospiraceae bacterium]|nr:hypothetical protein [Lachnospiraceae bacterium]
MRKRSFVIGAIAMVIAAAGVWSYPYWHTAYLICSLAKSESLSFQMEATLEPERLSKGQKQFLQTLSWILQIEDESCLKWRAKGMLSGHQGYAELYCEAFKEPLTETYFNKDEVLVNIRMIYEKLQGEFRKAHPLLGNMLPDWAYETYISLEQLQEIFEVDLKEMFQQSAASGLKPQSLWKNLLTLNRMKRHKTRSGEWQFQTTWNHYRIALQAGKNSDNKSFARLTGADAEKSQQIKSFVFLVSSEEKKVVNIPDSCMGTEEIRQFQKFWQTLKGFTEGRK